MSSPLGAADLARLAAAGIPESEAQRQLALLRDPPPPARLLRPATVGDGVLRPAEDRLAELERRGREARDEGRLSKFVPASGAASRMFRALAAVRARGLASDAERLAQAARAGDREAEAAITFLRDLPRTALAVPLAVALGVEPRRLGEAARGPLEPILAALLDGAGMAAAELPKALLPFHLEGDRTVSAFEEQLAEGLAYLVDRNGVARFHFTIHPGRRALFEQALAEARTRLETGGIRLEVDFSVQSPATDTLALDERGRPARTAAGELLLRPAGHGALLGNLGATGGDLVLVKNIDNVLPRARHAEIARWKLILAGLAAEADEKRTEEARDRPLRVCGVVPSAGEPGGGPFWTADAVGGESLQIVEFSQVDTGNPDQLAIWGSSTHFNPVDLVVSLRDAEGRSWPLESFVDPASAFVSRKSEGGRTLSVLERPGLWNGAMAGWMSHFVEVPGATFAPVKTVLDLARTAHATTPK